MNLQYFVVLLFLDLVRVVVFKQTSQALDADSTHLAGHRSILNQLN